MITVFLANTYICSYSMNNFILDHFQHLQFMECHFSMLEMLNTILDGPGLKTSSLWFATSKCAKYQDLKKRKEKVEQLHVGG